jgi:ATP synthase protein I
LTGLSERRYTRPALGGPPDPRDPYQNMWAGASEGLTITATMLSALGVWGGIGFLIDWLVGTHKVFTAIGLVLGAVLGTYLIYLRYGKEHGKR